MPAVSVLLPTFNQAAFLPDALAALAAQTFRDFELIACDDGSTDGTAEILRTANVRTVTHGHNRGTAAAINSAAMHATGRYWTWVSSDNVMAPHWLETLVAVLDANPAMRAVYSPYRRVDRFPVAGKKAPPQTQRQGPYDPARLIASVDCYFGPSFLVRREAWLEHRAGMAHDYDWWLRFEEQAIGYCPEPLCDYHMGPWQTGRNNPPKLVADARQRQDEAAKRRCKTPASRTAT